MKELSLDIGTIPELRNDYPINIYFGGRVYPSVEHAFQAAKTNDPILRQQIADAPSAKIAKYLGQKVEIRPDWDNIRYLVMETLVRQKFFCEEGKHCKEALLKTVGSFLFMNSKTDEFWGAYFEEEYEGDLFPVSGENSLGDILCSLREEVCILNGIGVYQENVPVSVKDSILSSVDYAGELPYCELLSTTLSYIDELAVKQAILDLVLDGMIELKNGLLTRI